MRVTKFIAVAVALMVTVSSAEARENVGQKKQRKSAHKALAEGCAAATSSSDLSINNVRTRILGSGDMWWDLDDAKYEVPKGSDKHSMFAGALWLGGYDEADQLKLAAMTYRQSGVDYWPGPLTDDQTASVTSETCERYNRHWTVYRDEVELHAAWIKCKSDPRCDEADRFPGYGPASVPLSIKTWPGNGVDGELPNKLAPYFEDDTNGIPGFYEYEWDYPAYDVDGGLDCQKKEIDILYGDQTIWWVYNDKGNVHTETQAGALGFEIRAQAFAFTSNDEVNNMTFNNYRIINKSTFKLTDTYFGTWFDPDVGNATDDIIGSDISRGLGYCYNKDNDDEGPNGYGQNPPAIGFDFFQGPFADYFDGVDNDRDGCVDGVRNDIGICETESQGAGINERIIMSGFMYYNNNSTNRGNPDVALDYYNYLRSLWKNGNSLIIETPSGAGSTANGDGFVASNTGTATVFAYPGLSYDTTGAFEPSQPIDWWESPAAGADKRGLHSAGPFSLSPGALNFITTGTVWARNFNSTDLFASVNDVIVADDKAQQLFDNCFNVLDGPDSPELEIVEMDKELILKLNNPFTSKTIFYNEEDPAITPDKDWTPVQIDSARKANYFSYVFEGFQVFQVAHADVSVENLYDRAQSRLIFQCDLKNNVEQLINFEGNKDFGNGALDPVDKTIQTENDGIKLSFRFTEDAFALGDKRLVNFKDYYFYVIAYSQNQWKIADARNLSVPAQKAPFLAGRRIGNGQKAWRGAPHKTQGTNGGTKINSAYGDGLPITRFSGAGSSGNFLRLTRESRRNIATSYASEVVDYEAGFGPFDVKVVDPTKVVAGDFILKFVLADTANPIDSAQWVIEEKTSGSIIATSAFNISFLGEQIIDDLGISVSFKNATRPGFDTLKLLNNGVVGAEVNFAGGGTPWLGGVPDNDTYSPVNWILAGNGEDGSQPGTSYNDHKFSNGAFGTQSPDPFGVFESLLGGTWAPTDLGSGVTLNGPNGTAGFGIKPVGRSIPVEDLPNVDIVITNDHTLWSRCPVIEMGDLAAASDDEKRKFTLRSGRTLNKTATGELVPDADPNNTGWSYFPGYAINTETGKRLNVAFGESSWLKADNGADMRWNPSNLISDKLGNFVMGGMHVVYVMADSARFGLLPPLTTGMRDLTYKGDAPSDYPTKDIYDNMESSYTLFSKASFSGFAWSTIPLVVPGNDISDYRNIPSDVTISLRVAKPYQRTNEVTNEGLPQYQFSTIGSETSHNSEYITDALNFVNVVPNPYNGSSDYERSQLENVVKITNLPHTCKVSIFMTNGTLIRSYNKANDNTFIEWDLKNDFNVPIASGIYIIHVDAGDLGQKVIKWMGSIRPIDLNAF